MQIFANKFNGSFLRNVLPGSDVDVDGVMAAIAYGSDSKTLLAHCLEHQHRLDLWMRYDHSVPVTPKLLRELLKATSKNVFCRLIPDVHHAKVIWWRGYGVYIGSANLTERAWVSNLEVGIFLSEEELMAGECLSEISSLFDTLEALSEAFPLTEEIVDEQEKLYSARSKALQQLDKDGIYQRSKPVWGGPAEVAKRTNALERRKAHFIKEWESALTILRSIADLVEDHQPSWVPENTPAPWQADQFLHAYYYNKVAEGSSHPFNKYHEMNRANPEQARNEALQWWSELSSAPSNEDINLGEQAPTIRHMLRREYVKNLDSEALSAVFAANHSTDDHVAKIPAEFFGKPAGAYVPLDERIRLFAKRILEQKNKRGESFPELLHYVLYSGPWQQTPDRIFEAAKNPDRKFERIGLNQLAELVGWALPEHFPPRNGRTSKALRALGYDVDIY